LELTFHFLSRDSSVSKVTGYGLPSPRHRVQTGSGLQPASPPMATVGPAPGVRRPRCEANHNLRVVLRLRMFLTVRLLLSMSS